jgi:hypothetical protein
MKYIFLILSFLPFVSKGQDFVQKNQGISLPVGKVIDISLFFFGLQSLTFVCPQDGFQFFGFIAV